MLDELLPRLSIQGVSPEENPGRAPLAAIFADGRPLWLEVGFGGGEHLVHQAAAHPEVGLIGCEPFINGVGMALVRIAAAGLSNVRLHPGDARDLIDLLPDGALARVFLLYPDPWPKARHHRRRFASPENLAALHRVMAHGRRAPPRHRHPRLRPSRPRGRGGHAGLHRGLRRRRPLARTGRAPATRPRPSPPAAARST